MSKIDPTHDWTAAEDYKLHEAIAWYLVRRDAAENITALWWAMVTGRTGVYVSPAEVRLRWLHLSREREATEVTLGLARSVDALEAEGRWVTVAAPGVMPVAAPGEERFPPEEPGKEAAGE